MGFGETGNNDSAPSFDVGQFWYHFDEDRWVWSDELARIHGYPSADVVELSTALMVKHKHPDDKDRVEALIRHIRSAREPFSSQHRLVDVHGKIVPVVVVADIFADGEGRLVGTTGYYVTLAEDEAVLFDDPSARQAVQERVNEVIGQRAVIEQAKGVIRFVYRLDDKQAFDLLTWRSQETNTKVRDLAAAICDLLGTVELPSSTRAGFDHLLLTAHENIVDDPS